MSVFLGLMLIITFAVAMVIAPIAWVCGVIFGFKTIANRKPGVSWHSMFETNNLTDEGLRYRAAMVKAMAWFAIPIGLALALGAVTGTLK